MAQRNYIEKKFITPETFRTRFGYTEPEYEVLLEKGLPVIHIGSIIRHDIDEIREWAYENRIILKDRYHCISKKMLKEYFKINSKTLTQWMALGLKCHYENHSGIMKQRFYLEEVLAFIDEMKTTKRI